MINFKKYIMERKDDSWKKTSWEDGGIKVTIEDVINYLDENEIPVKSISIDKIKPIIIQQDYEGKHKKRIKKAKNEYPIIVIVSKGKYKSILDGNHRAYKALKNKMEKIKVRELNLDLKETPQEFKKLFDYKIEKLSE
jgi:hydrogenase maturation factor HypE